MKADVSAINNAAEKSAGIGKMKNQAITLLAAVATANTPIIGRTLAAFVRASAAICHNSTVCRTMAMEIDQPNPMKKSK